MLNITHNQRNANQHYNEISHHFGHNGYRKKSTNSKGQSVCGQKMKLALFVIMYIDMATMEDNMEIP